MNELLNIGFRQVGYWSLVNRQLSLVLDPSLSQQNVLYAFIENQQVRYVGKTTKTLARRMYGYLRPSESQSTNLRLNKLLYDSLLQCGEIQILALPDLGQIHYGTFQLNLAAGLEDNMIAVVQPKWNYGHRDDGVDASPEVLPESVHHRFSFTLQPTYFDRGFFNVPASHGDAIGKGGDTLSIKCEDPAREIAALIDRRANQNGSPRIMGGSQLRDWFQHSGNLGATIQVEVSSPNSICLHHDKQ